MATDLKAATPDTTIAAGAFLFGADSQASASPSVYQVDTTLAAYFSSLLNGQATLSGATVTTTAPLLNHAQTWNAGAQTFTGWKLNVTDTASASGSLLMDLQVGGSSKFTVRKDGAVSGTTFDLLSGSGGISNSGGPWAASSGRMAFGGNFAGPFLQYDGNNSTLGLLDGTNAQTLNIYNTWSSAGANYERGFLKWTSNEFQIGTEAGGTGSSRDLVLKAAGTLYLNVGGYRWAVNSAGHINAVTDNVYDIGASGASRPRNLYVAGTVTASTFTGTNVNATNVIFGGGAGSYISQSVNGIIALYNNAGTGFTLLQFGGTTSSFPAIKRSTTSLQARLADDSAFTAIQGKLTTDTAYTATPPTCTGYITIYDSTGTPYKVMVST